MICTLFFTTNVIVNNLQLNILLDNSVNLEPEVLFQAMRNRCDYLADSYIHTDRFKPLVRRSLKFSPLDLLISKGELAIPYLISQLSSSQTCNLVLGGDFVKYTEYEAYDSKARGKHNNAWPAVETNDLLIDDKRSNRHTVTRGDIAFFAIGQIVNRWYGVIRSYPGAVFYCPISKNSKLQQFVKSDWNGINKESLRKSLETDILHPDSLSRQVSGFQRYRCRFPITARNVALKCLSHSYGKVSDTEPRSGSSSLFNQFGVIASAKIDEACYRMIQSENSFDSSKKEYQLTKIEILYYLVGRSRFRDFAISYAEKMISHGMDSRGLYSMFIMESHKPIKKT